MHTPIVAPPQPAVKSPTPAELDALADAAHAEWAIHWSVCFTRRKGINSWCVACDQLDLAANRAESVARSDGEASRG